MANLLRFKAWPVGSLRQAAGDVVYGNIGSETRLDFTVIGAAVNEATRIEALCRTLGRPLLISAEFVKVCTCHPLVSLGHHRLRGTPL